jgi:hypothetical protein
MPRMGREFPFDCHLDEHLLILLHERQCKKSSDLIRGGEETENSNIAYLEAAGAMCSIATTQLSIFR